MSFSFVTGYFEFNKDITEEYFNNFYKLASLKFPILLFLDSKLKDSNYYTNLQKYTNINIQLTNFSDLPLTNILDLQTPSGSSKELIILQNSKPLLLKLAKDINNKPTLVWINFNIFKDLKESEVPILVSNFNQLKIYNKIIIPGNFEKKKLLQNSELFETKSNRFISDLMICPRDLIDSFYDAYMKEVNMHTSRLTYETNYLMNTEINNVNLIHYTKSKQGIDLFKFYEKKLILISMIKNEEKIIRRCIDSVKNICDAFCVSDTMSTDSTIQVVNDYINEQNKLFNIPGKIYQNPWKNFGHNRTISYHNTVDFCLELGWDLNNTYGLLLDADMKLVIKPTFDKQSLTHNGYRIIQDNNFMDYQNTRFVKLNKSWKCTGVTHEYWDGPDLESIGKDKIYIYDIGDGGCKNDKFERDMKLLIAGIEEEPKNGRYHFYLAQTLKDLGKFKESIAFYKRRIEIGGWDEEVWYSHYMISKVWQSLGNLIKCEAWAMKAYEFRKSRPEPLYMLVNLFREKSQHFKSYHYYRIAKNIPETNDVLFVEKNIPQFLLDYEYTILHYWLFPNEKLVGLKETINYLNKTNYYEDNVFSNMDFYLEKLDGEIQNIIAPLFDMFCASSPSIINYNNKTIVNLRYVNYRIQLDGSYMMYDKDSFTKDHHVKTKNALVYLDDKLNFIDMPVLFNEEITDIPVCPTWIHGLEDIRLFEFQNKIHYTATTREYSYNCNNRIVIGEYDTVNLKYINNKVLYPPTETDCEKNWIPINNCNKEILFVYKWHPLQIGKLDEKNKLNIIYSHDTPVFFKNYRGSSSICEYNNQLWCITHGVKYSTPRRYFHQFVVLDKTSFKPIKFSVPFYFNNFKIEYCNGLMIKGNELIIIFSQNDADPCILKTSMNRINKLMINL